jgi:tetratricopeptide (TPR) repeat protein
MVAYASNSSRALERIELALKKHPESATLLVQKALCLRDLRRMPEALVVAAHARPSAWHDPQALDALGAFYSLAGEQQRALESYDRLLTIAPNNPSTHLNRAAVRRFLGDLGGAECDYDRTIKAQPSDFEAYFNRSELRVQTSDRNHIRELDALLQRPISSWRGEVQLRYALAKEYEDVGEYPRAWEQLSRGAALRRRHLQYDVRADLDAVERICSAFPTTPPVEGYPSTEPIFVVGLPRSGTTLVERILSSHSMVSGAGELDHFAQALVAAVRRKTGREDIPRKELIEHSARLDFRELGTDYVERTRPTTGLTPRFTDKMPLNYLYCALIRHALPKARVVHVARHPIAVCHAMYKTLFKQGYPFSYDLEETGKYYIAYRRLMKHWLETLPEFIYHISYERLIADQEGETRRLLEFCGLEWEDGCLAFERNPAPTTTASASQVRRALYNSSVSLWRHYSNELRSLQRQLAGAGIDVS